ncbi:MAG: MotA/TolQ/ExbB proton channel family protein [Cyclobacteriaceae bacterium]|nr:MotA/TolQ/ExbB proton channel family protein [Cyclobacteriaceae bacterium]
MKQRYYRIGAGFLAAVVLMIVLSLSISSIAETSSLRSILILLGADISGGGYIQGITFFFFFWGLLEIYWLNAKNIFERKYLNYDLLPKQEHYVMGPAEINSVRVKVNDYLETRSKEVEEDFYLLFLIKKACTKFRAEFSISEAFNIVTNQTKINTAKSESAQSYIRYIAWAIPSIGFIGTVIGISDALSIAAGADINAVAEKLGVAFNTTLVSLILSVIIMWLIHALQEASEKMHSEFEEYVIDNLINKMDVG